MADVIAFVQQLFATYNNFIYCKTVLRAAFRKYRPTVGTSSKFDFAHIWLIDNP